MSDFEITQLILKYRKQLQRWRRIESNQGIPIYIISNIIGISFIIIGACMLSSYQPNAFVIGWGTFFLLLGCIFEPIYIVFTIIYCVKHANAPRKIVEIRRNIEGLEKEKNGNKNDVRVSVLETPKIKKV